MGVSELRDSQRLQPARLRRHQLGRITIVACQNALLWAAVYVVASTIYLLVIGAIDTQAIPSAVMYLLAGILSLFYLVLQNTVTHLRTRARSMIDGERVDGHQSLAAHTLPILVTIWTIASGLCIMLTAVRQPLCAFGTIRTKMNVVDHGHVCIIHRVAILTGLVGMIATLILILLMRRLSGANRCHLLGIVSEHKLLPLFLAHKERALRAMPSEMSFKCRSSTSISAKAMALREVEHEPLPLVTESWLPLPPKPTKTDISCSKASVPPSLLQARPSMSSIRSHTSLYLPPPPASPLPPLSAYLANRLHAGSTMHTAIYPPRSFSRPVTARPSRSHDILDLLPPPPVALSSANLAVLSRRRASFSSIYSRDTTGESQVLPKANPLPSLTSSSRSSSSSSVSTIQHTPVTMTALEHQPRPKMSFDSSTGSAANTSSLSSECNTVLSFEPVAPLQIRKATVQPQSALEQKLRQYAESQSRIRQTSYTPLMQNNVRCPERFRFE